MVAPVLPFVAKQTVPAQVPGRSVDMKTPQRALQFLCSGIFVLLCGELPSLVGIDGSSLRSVQECRKHDGLVHFQFRGQLEAVTIPHGELKSAEVLASFADPASNLVINFGAAA
ncbi:unnamed protein product [Dibothriocephalus latus]|uniref:Uncharacterized protein n=1 Tax=Dibothriocephalus latus TaxID=60516 RepID=A0A3P7LFG2_DIBLA|nr:unnamed protein product [Dibothriocephalus latus]